MATRSLRLAWLSGVALLLATAGAGFVLIRDADVLALRLPTRKRAPAKGERTRPRDAVEHFQCNRCHVVPGLEPESARLAENCVTCHQAIAAGRLDLWYQSADVEKWNQHITHLVRTPDLRSLGQRVKRSWLTGWLQAPHVVRPFYGATMPRLNLGPRDAELIADFFGVTEEESAEPAHGDAARGRALYGARQCAACHFRGDSPLASLRYGALEFRSPPARRRAPDLKYVRSRMSLPQLRRWLSDPHAVIPDTEMPAFHFTPDEVEDLATFLGEPLPGVGPPPRPARPPRVLDRPVRYAEVAQKLSRHLCFHCHSDLNRPGDQGPGNSGGFGYEGVSLDLATRAGLLRGVKRDGQFRGLPDRLENGMPRLVASLLAREAELEGSPTPGCWACRWGSRPSPTRRST